MGSAAPEYHYQWFVAVCVVAMARDSSDQFAVYRCRQLNPCRIQCQCLNTFVVAAVVDVVDVVDVAAAAAVHDDLSCEYFDQVSVDPRRLVTIHSCCFVMVAAAVAADTDAYVDADFVVE